MEMILHGFKHSKGEYEGRHYDNYRLFTSNLFGTDYVVGHEVNNLKVTPTVFNDFMLGKTDEMVLGKKIDVTFGMNNIIQKIELVK